MKSMSMSIAFERKMSSLFCTAARDPNPPLILNCLSCATPHTQTTMPSYQLLNDLYAKTQTSIQTLENTHNILYLGTALEVALNATDFVSVAKEHILVRKPMQVHHPNTQTPPSQMQSSSTSPSSNSTLPDQQTSSSTQNSRQSTSQPTETSQSVSTDLSERQDDNSSDPLVLSVIAVVNSNNFFFTSDGKFNTSTAPKPFAESKIQCSTCAPDISPLNQHFTNALNAMRKLQNKVIAPGPNIQIDGPIKMENNKSFIKIQHVLFEVRNPSSSFNYD